MKISMSVLRIHAGYVGTSSENRCRTVVKVHYYCDRYRVLGFLTAAVAVHRVNRYGSGAHHKYIGNILLLLYYYKLEDDLSTTQQLTTTKRSYYCYYYTVGTRT